MHTPKVSNKDRYPGQLAVATAMIGIAVAISGCKIQITTETTGTTSATFVGQWHVHGSTMDITPKSVSIVTDLCPSGPGECRETDTLTVVSGDDKQLTLRVIQVGFQANGGRLTSPGQATALGDSLQFVSQAPGLLKATILHGFPGWAGGNSYWCGAGVSPSDAAKCGA